RWRAERRAIPAPPQAPRPPRRGTAAVLRERLSFPDAPQAPRAPRRGTAAVLRERLSIPDAPQAPRACRTRGNRERSSTPRAPGTSAMPNPKKVVLAYSGGLDTSVIL